MGTVDKTLFLLCVGNDILIVQIYVDDIIFGGSSHDLVAKFAGDMSREFEMSMMGGVVVLPRPPDQAARGWDVRAPRQVHEGHGEKVCDGRLQADVDTDGYDYSDGC